MSFPVPELRRECAEGVCVWTDLRLREEGIVVAFSERCGGASETPFESLNLAKHVGDDDTAVEENRRRLLSSLGLEPAAGCLVTAEQVHGATVTLVGAATDGCASVGAPRRAPEPATDALVTRARRLPLLLCFADCVPLVLVAPGPVVSVVHAGWRGALSGLPGLAVASVTREAGCAASGVIAYIGPHIGACHYAVGDEILSQFVNTFDTVARAESGGLDLGAAVTVSLRSAGVDPCNIAGLGVCTAETTDRFFSYRAETGLTGRHGALACIL